MRRDRERLIAAGETAPAEEPDVTFTDDELDTLKDWARGETKSIRRWAGQDLERRKADGVLSRPARLMMNLITGPGHKARCRRVGRRLAFSFLFLIVTGPARRQAAGWPAGPRTA